MDNQANREETDYNAIVSVILNWILYYDYLIIAHKKTQIQLFFNLLADTQVLKKANLFIRFQMMKIFTNIGQEKKRNVNYEET